jgi:hypothetical protein
MVKFTPWPFNPGERTPAPIEYAAEWALEPVWKTWRRKKSLALLGFEPQTVQPIT